MFYFVTLFYQWMEKRKQNENFWFLYLTSDHTLILNFFHSYDAALLFMHRHLPLIHVTFIKPHDKQIAYAKRLKIAKDLFSSSLFFQTFAHDNCRWLLYKDSSLNWMLHHEENIIHGILLLTWPVPAILIPNESFHNFDQVSTLVGYSVEQ